MRRLETADLSENGASTEAYRAGQLVRKRAIISRTKAVYLVFLPWGK